MAMLYSVFMLVIKFFSFEHLDIPVRIIFFYFTLSKNANHNILQIIRDRFRIGKQCYDMITTLCRLILQQIDHFSLFFSFHELKNPVNYDYIVFTGIFKSKSITYNCIDFQPILFL